MWEWGVLEERGFKRTAGKATLIECHLRHHMEEMRVGIRWVPGEEHSRQKAVCTCTSLSPSEEARVAGAESASRGERGGKGREGTGTGHTGPCGS